jgi:prevent-host-death family protein
MKTITAVEFRRNMGDILARVNSGEEYLITYRNTTSVRLVPELKTNIKKKFTGLDLLNSAPRKNFKFNKNKSTKELYSEFLEEKHGESNI